MKADVLYFPHQVQADKAKTLFIVIYDKGEIPMITEDMKAPTTSALMDGYNKSIEQMRNDVLCGLVQMICYKYAGNSKRLEAIEDHITKELAGLDSRQTGRAWFYINHMYIMGVIAGMATLYNACNSEDAIIEAVGGRKALYDFQESGAFSTIELD